VKYKIIEAAHSVHIAKLAVCLTQEIIERTGIQHFDVDVPQAIKLCENYVANGVYTVMAAFDDKHDNQIVGFGALCESHSLYAEGAFGIIQEFYVLPEYRSQDVGKTLIENMVALGKQKQWRRLELCTPPLPEFDRTLSFYEANGFEVTGGRKMKVQLA